MMDGHSRIVTVPNVITAIRIAGIPVLLVMLMHHDWQWPAFFGLGLLAATDWIDGALARRLDQVSDLGRILDPIADHLLIHASGLALAFLGFLPWWIPVSFAVGDAVFLTCFAIDRRAMIGLRVSWTARARAVCVGVGYPLALLAALLSDEHLRMIALILLCVGILFQVLALTTYIVRAHIRRPIENAIPPGVEPAHTGKGDRA